MQDYSIESCSAYTNIEICGKPIILFNDHNMALPVWGTYANKTAEPLNLLTFDTHTDTRHPFGRYLSSEFNVAPIIEKNKILQNHYINNLLNSYHVLLNDYYFEDAYKMAYIIAHDEQILTSYILGYIKSYTVVHKIGDNFDDRIYGYDSEYIMHNEFVSGREPKISNPLILDIDLDYFNQKKEIFEFIMKVGLYIKSANVITIAREPDCFEKYKTEDDFTVDKAEEILLEGIESVLKQV